MNQPGSPARDDEPSRDARGGSVVFRFDRSTMYEPLPMPPPGAGDAMRWGPPPDGEDTPPCPA